MGWPTATPICQSHTAKAKTFTYMKVRASRADVTTQPRPTPDSAPCAWIKAGVLFVLKGRGRRRLRRLVTRCPVYPQTTKSFTINNTAKEPEESEQPEESNDFCREIPASAVIAARVADFEEESLLLLQQLDDLLPTTPDSDFEIGETPGAPKKSRYVLTPEEVDQRLDYMEQVVRREEERALEAERQTESVNAFRVLSLRVTWRKVLQANVRAGRERKRAERAERKVDELKEQIVHLEELFARPDEPEDEVDDESENEADVICGDTFQRLLDFFKF